MSFIMRSDLVGVMRYIISIHTQIDEAGIRSVLTTNLIASPVEAMSIDYRYIVSVYILLSVCYSAGAHSLRGDAREVSRQV